MPKKKKGKKRGFSVQTMFKFVRLGALLAPAAARALESGRSGEYKLKAGLMDYTGFNLNTGEWKFEAMARGWMPYLATTAITHGISKLVGIIRGL